ncbi:hypothetical protein [Burkholderia catarinensis]|uniref:hypothetical protein n=1 Tax=Burkholderia catarinensis TaxID=1108140 RepID=UPI000AB2DE28|nr:hypothetical protein [Burkholderia catarinensis]
MAESSIALLCWPSLPSPAPPPMIEIRAARYPDDARVVAFNPVPGTEFLGRDL